MKARSRRLLLFVAMVATGLAVAYLLSDPFVGRGRATVGEATDDASGRIRIVGEAAEDQTTVLLGRVEFELTRDVEVAPGRVEERAAYRVRIAAGRPDENGDILAEQPDITVLDHRSGSATGTLRADEARFETVGAVAGQVTLDFGRMRAENFTLSGDVRGRFAQSDGLQAELEADTLRVRGPLVSAPGRVRWTRPDLAVDGVDLTWDEESGALDLRTDAHLVLAASGGRPGYAFDAPAGLSVIVPPEGAPASERARAELRGPVTGTSTDGGRLEAETLRVDAVTGLVTLHGSSVFERETETGLDRLTASNVSVRTDDEGRIRIAEADGGVRLLHAPVALMPAALATESLRVVDDVAHAPGRVTWDRADLRAAGTAMDWDLVQGHLEFDRDAEIALAKEAEHPLAGLRLVAPGGMSWTLPPGVDDALSAATGNLRGGVTGTLPDGTTLAADMLLFDGSAGTFRLVGSAAFRQAREGGVSQLDADRVTITTGGDGRIAMVTADGQVLVVSGPVDVLPMRLEGEHVERGNGRLRSEGRVTWTRGDVTIAGTDMSVDETAGRLDFARDAHVVLHDADGAVSLEAHAPGGLTWQAPPGASDPRAEGRGTLHGPVTATTADGLALKADRLELDGPSGTLRLAGRASLASDEGLLLESERIALVSRDDARRVEVPGAARWVLPDAQGRGAGLVWDDLEGTLSVQRDVQLTLVSAEGGLPWELQAAGSLRWTRALDAPPGARLRGRGEVRDGVRGRHAADGAFRTEHLVIDGSGGRLTMLGPSRWTDDPEGRDAAERGARGMALEASTRIEVAQSSSDAASRRLVAEGEARATLPPRGDAPPAELAAERIEIDEATRTVSLLGDAVVHGLDAELPARVEARDRLLARLDAADALDRIEASGGVVFERGFRVEGAALVWDVAADEATLHGSCLLRHAGAVMRCERVEVRPRERTFRILRSAVQLDG